MYSKEYMRHFQNPQNIGDLENADAVEEVRYTGEGCFDRIRIFGKKDDGKIAKVTYRVRGCSGTIAACSAMSELAAGLPLDQAASVQGSDVARALGGVPERKQHSVNLAEEALRTVASALQDKA
ncbi:MAG TPA: iron-sulfur cluster assembly scaffold protein [bacterium]